jgi:hypothetical protein
MLDPWIIEEIRRREEEEQKERERPVVELPLDHPVHPRPQGKSEENRDERGVVVVDFRVI